MHSQWFLLPFRTVQYIEKTLHKLAHHRNYLTKQNKTYRKSLQWSEKRLPYLQAFKKEFDSLTTGRRQEETEDLSNKKKKNIILPSAGNNEWQVEQDGTLTRFYMMSTSITDSIKITENGEVFTGNPHTNRYLQRPCNYPWFHTKKERPERRGAPYLML